MCDGLGFGANTRAALITRGLAEITRLGVAMGGKPETFMGLAGLGDLALTCTDDQSRNRRMGLALARGLSIEQARAEMKAAGEKMREAMAGLRLSDDDMRRLKERAREMGKAAAPTPDTPRFVGELSFGQIAALAPTARAPRPGRERRGRSRGRP